MALLLSVLVLSVLSLLLPAFASVEDDSDDPDQMARLFPPIAVSKRRLEHRKEELELAREELSISKELNASLKERIQREDQIKKLELEVAMAKKKAAIEAAKAAAESDQSDQNKQDNLTQLRKELAQIRKDYKDLSDGISAGDKAAENFVETLQTLTGVSRDAGGSIVGSFAKAIIEGEGLANTLRRVGAGLKETFNFTNITTSVYRKFAESTFQLATAQDTTISSFIRATGASEDYGTIITDSFMRTRTLGVSMQEAGEAAESLYNNMAFFSLQSDEMQGRMIDQVATMNQFGISNEVASRSLDVLVRVLGKSVPQALSTQEELANFADRIGVPPAQLMQELADTAPALAQWGGQTEGVLMDLAEASKATGIAMSGLIGITERFDTFEGAAEATGRLNSILGGPFINNMELLMAEPADKIRMLGDAFRYTGRSWEDLHRFERQAIASAAGISDMTQATAIFSGDMEENIALLEQQNDEQKELAERARDAQSVYDMLQTIVHTLAIDLRPVVEGVRDMLQGRQAGGGLIGDFETISSRLNEFVNETTDVVKSIGSFISEWGKWILIGGTIVGLLNGILRPIMGIANFMGFKTKKIYDSARAYGVETGAIMFNTQQLIRNRAARAGTMMGPGMGGGGGQPRRGPPPIPADAATQAGRAGRAAGVGRRLLGGAGRIASFGLLGGVPGLLVGGAVVGGMYLYNRAQRRNEEVQNQQRAIEASPGPVRISTTGAGAAANDRVGSRIAAEANNNREILAAIERSSNRPISLIANGRELGRVVENTINEGGGIALNRSFV